MNLLKLTDFQSKEIFEIFEIADDIKQGKYSGILKGKSIVMFFPDSSIRTRVTFEKGIYLLGGQPILFPNGALDKKEDLKDVCGYLNNWADAVIVRHEHFHVIEKMAEYLKVPVINAMTKINHPCEIMTDMYALSKIRKDFTSDKYLFCGIPGNIGLSWKEASELMGFEFSQCCGNGYEIDSMMNDSRDDVRIYNDISEAIIGKDIVCTDSIPSDALKDFKNCQVTSEIMEMANEGAILNPCPPFYRGEEVSDDVIESKYFVGYEFKKDLLYVQQAIIIYLMAK